MHRTSFAFNTFSHVGFASMLLSCFVVGCSGSNESTVTGTVTAEGKPVSAGTLNITPLGGAGASGISTISAKIGSDGSFKTAVAVPVGQAKLTYVDPGPAFPEGYVPKPSEPAPESPYRKMSIKDPEVSISAHAPLKVELVAKGKVK